MPKRLCNQFLPKTLRFSLQRHKSSRIRLAPNSRNSLPVSVLECFPAFGSRRSASGFGLGLLVRLGFLGAKAGHSDRAVRRVEESCFGFWKAKETALLKKRQKSAFSKAGKDKGGCDGFPSPYLFTRNFAVSHLLLKMRCIFFTEQSYTDQGAPLDP